MTITGTKIFQQNRALGYVTNHVKASIRFIKKRKENVIVTCIGRSFQLYSGTNFRLFTVSGLHADDIDCITSDNYYVYSTCSSVIYCWKMGRIIQHTLKGHEHNVHTMLPFGKHLIAIDESNLVKIWDIKTESCYLEIPFNAQTFKITAVAHPLTYVNKILLGSEQGVLQLWNIKKSRLVHTFESFDSQICVLEQAPALDTMAVGLKSGKIALINLKFGETLMEFSQDFQVTGISFRTDGHPIMVTSTTDGQILFWNLDERRIISQIMAHDDVVTTLKCFTNEPLILSTSPDNSMKLWICDLPDGGARLLRERQGHAAPPTFIRFHGQSGHNILSAGEDSSLRIFSTLSENLNQSLGKASYNRQSSKKKNRFKLDHFRMPHITSFTSDTTREKEWDNIAALHSGLVMATTWTFHKQKMGEHKLVPTKFQNQNPEKDFTVEATSIYLTHCGNFVVIGYSNGDVERFNIQSGIHRMSYGNPAHTKSAIRGVATDLLNQFVVSGGASDGLIKFWNFVTKPENPPFDTLNMKSGVSLFALHRESSMLGVALDDFSISIVDLDTRTVIRNFQGHAARITDMTFTPDSRWLISSGMDRSIKVWDIPSSYLIDHFKLQDPCISLTMSPTGKFLATALANNLGIHLWSNKSLYSHISLRAVNPDSEAPEISLPQSSEIIDSDSIEEDMELIQLDEGEELEMKYESPDQLDNFLLTMSTVALSRWQNLLSLDVIKKRNQPKQPLSVPKQAPFFLPTVAGPELKFDMSDAIPTATNSKLVVPSKINNFTVFGNMLQESLTTQSLQPLVKHFTQLGPSMIDYEIKSLSPYGGGSVGIMEQFLKMILFMFESRLNFELTQSYLALFLKTHQEEICKNHQLRQHLSALEIAQTKGWKTLEDSLLYGIGVVSAIRNYVN